MCDLPDAPSLRMDTLSDVQKARGFLILTHCFDRPERYAEPRRFDTMPSQPSLQAC